MYCNADLAREASANYFANQEIFLYIVPLMHNQYLLSLLPLLIN